MSEAAVESEGVAEADLEEARVALLEAENARLRRHVLLARRQRYRRAALGLGAVGLLAAGAAVVLPDERTVLLALGATGLFGAFLTYYLTPERFVPAGVTGALQDATSSNLAAVVEELGLQDDRIYLPTPGRVHPAKLFIPQHPDYTLPENPRRLFVVTDDERTRGVALVPHGATLWPDVEASLSGDPRSPLAVADALAEAVVETLELCAGTEATTDRAREGVLVEVDGPAYGDLRDPDHPIVSVLGVGLAIKLETPVAVEVHDAGRADGLVVLRPVEAE